MSTDKCSDQKIQEGWIKKKKNKRRRTYKMLPTRDSLQGQRHTDRKWGVEKYISCKCNDKKEWVAIFILDKIDFEIGHKERQQKA